jgi:aminoglycoside phosphotransferase family enzyme/predicted kinase
VPEALREHQALVAGLQQWARNQGHEPVLISTGISSVLLIGEHAYKLRKPIQLDFLDFSTLALRQADCEAELRLNQRTAPALYLDVCAVRGSLAQPHIDPATQAGPALDWALRMRRFDPAQGYDQLAARGQLQAQQMHALAAHIAAFHAGLTPSPPHQGQPVQIGQRAQANFDSLLGHSLSQPWHAQLQALHRWTTLEQQRLQPLMANRHLDGWVREGHGDLHLGNVLWQNGQAWAFDAIEFNDALRHVDVIDDFAFVWMDLHRHGLRGLAALCLNSYLEALGDWGGLVLLRWYAVYRALVRAKVALLRAAQARSLGQSPSADLQALALDIAAAESLCVAPMTPPCLVLTTGLSGSGKSTAASRLVQQLGAVCARADVERKRLHGLAPLDRSGAAQGLYSVASTLRTYARLDALALQGLQAGWPVVIDAAALKRQEREHLRALAGAQGATFVLLSCEAPTQVLHARLALRSAQGHDASDADPSVLVQQLRWQEAVQAEEAACHWVLT